MKFKNDLQCMCLNATLFELYEYIKIQHTCTKNVNCGKRDCLQRRLRQDWNSCVSPQQFRLNTHKTAHSSFRKYLPSDFSHYINSQTRDFSFVSERKLWSRTCGCNVCQNDSSTIVGLPQFTSWAVYYQEQFYQQQPWYSEPYPKHHGDYPNQYRQYPNYNRRYQNPYEQYPHHNGKYQNQYGQYRDNNGKYQNQYGQYPDQNGKYQNQYGQYPDQNGKYQNQYGQYSDQNGKYQNRYRQYSDHIIKEQNRFRQHRDHNSQYAEQKYYNYKTKCGRYHNDNGRNIAGVTVHPMDDGDGKSKYDIVIKLLIFF